ncbi:MAG: hypothetical protein ISQ75_02865 [Puniceicoccaceae bacterium]|nr:hypothetical protein [Puniceicoccaceae bacterium]
MLFHILFPILTSGLRRSLNGRLSPDARNLADLRDVFTDGLHVDQLPGFLQQIEGLGLHLAVSIGSNV